MLNSSKEYHRDELKLSSTNFEHKQIVCTKPDVIGQQSPTLSVVDSGGEVTSNLITIYRIRIVIVNRIQFSHLRR